MRITFRSTLPQDKVNEGSQFNVYIKFWDDSTDAWVAQVPTTVRYNIYGESGEQIRDWTTVTPASSATISVTGTDNAVISYGHNSEMKVLTVQADAGLSTQYAATYAWTVCNLNSITA